MKKFLLPACFIVAACGSDDSYTNLTVNEQNLRGKWQLQSIMRNGASYPLEECMSQNTVEFKNTGAYIQFNFGTNSGSCAVDSLINGSYDFENDSIFLRINTQDTIRPAALLDVNEQTLRLNGRIYLGDDQEGSDEIIFTRVNPQ
jgi:hypothetical protein